VALPLVGAGGRIADLLDDIGNFRIIDPLVVSWNAC
jgi:hypothetical protein